MRVLVQRVAEAAVEVEGKTVARIGPGLLCLVGFAAGDGPDDVAWLSHKVTQLRIFEDSAGQMNRSLLDTGGDILAVSQFTLYASTRKGNRPSFSAAAPPALAQPLFDRFVAALSSALGRAVPTGVFGARMRVALVNDGPVTIGIDSAQRE
jgi:D-tyrosyl-tRNA(Tyr) deacylase